MYIYMEIYIYVHIYTTENLHFLFFKYGRKIALKEKNESKTYTP